jgi:hypothetical protein
MKSLLDLFGPAAIFGKSAKSLKRFGVPREFELEHPAEQPENAGFPTPKFQSPIESNTYGVVSTGLLPITIYPYPVLNMKWY